MFANTAAVSGKSLYTSKRQVSTAAPGASSSACQVTLAESSFLCSKNACTPAATPDCGRPASKMSGPHDVMGGGSSAGGKTVEAAGHVGGDDKRPGGKADMHDRLDRGVGREVAVPLVKKASLGPL
jgi:hypothetical protein